MVSQMESENEGDQQCPRRLQNGHADGVKSPGRDGAKSHGQVDEVKSPEQDGAKSPGPVEIGKVGEEQEHEMCCQMCGEIEQRRCLVTLSKRHRYPTRDNHVTTQRIQTKDGEVFEVMDLSREGNHHVVNDRARKYHGAFEVPTRPRVVNHHVVDNHEREYHGDARIDVNMFNGDIEVEEGSPWFVIRNDDRSRGLQEETSVVINKVCMNHCLPRKTNKQDDAQLACFTKGRKTIASIGAKNMCTEEEDEVENVVCQMAGES